MNYLKHINRHVLLILVAVAGLASCGKNSKNGFSIDGKIQNLEGKTILFVRDYSDSTIVDSIQVEEKGNFRFKGVCDTLMLGTLYFNKGTSCTSIFIDKGLDISIEGDANYPDLIKVKGGDENNDLTKFKENNKQTLMARAKLLNIIRKNLPHDAKPPKPNPNIISKISNLNFQLTNKAAEFIKNHPDKIASVILLQDFFKNDESIDPLDKKLLSLKAPASKFELTYQLKQYVGQIKASQEGAIAPDFSLKDANGTEIRGNSYMGKYLLLSFATDDCLLCVKNKEELDEINKTYKKEQVSIVSVTVSENDTTNGKPETNSKKKTDNKSKTGWKIITLKDGWSAKILSDLNINELPLNILISPTGKILARTESPVQLKPKLPKPASLQQ